MTKTRDYKYWMKWLSALVGIFVGLLVVVIAIAYYNQDTLVRESVARLNHDFKGRLEIGGSHISPFANFPYISIDLEDIKVFEGKETDSEVLLNVADTYLGFDFWTVIGGTFDIKAVKLDSGFLKLVQHKDGSFNITNALTSKVEDEKTAEPESTFHLDLQAIELINVDLLKLNEETDILVEAYIENAQSSLKSTNESTEITLDSRFLFNLIIESDTSFLHDKHVELHTALDFQSSSNKLTISPSELQIEKALFLMEGDIDIDDDMDLNLSFSGNKPNFDLFLAFAPPELLPVLDRYNNGGRIYFDAKVNGKSINGNAPQIELDFGCEEAFVHNTQAEKEVNELFFKGHFTNGKLRNTETMKLTIEDFSATPEAGTFQGNITVENFDSPDIDMQLNSQFDLDFLAGFLNLDNLKDVSGSIALQMNFHDIIDLENPEKSIERLNESYYTELKVEKLNFTSSGYGLPIRDVNIYGAMDGHKAEIERFDFKIGKSDISMKASVSDLPAILHHSSIPVDVILDIQSNLIDFTELTYNKEDSVSAFDEQLKDLSLRFKFNSSARAFTESPNLPVGEFFVEQLKAKLTNYPHALHDFNADIFIDETNFRVIDFTGMIDDSDFHFNGKLENYDLWFEENPRGQTTIDFDLDSDLLQLEDLFSYGGENFVPEDYRHEEFRNLKLHGLTSLVFNQSIQSTQINIDHLSATMKVHPMRFENFSGSFFMDSIKCEVKGLGGQLGNSNFKADLIYYHGEDNDKQHQFNLTSTRLDFDQLFAYNPPPASTIGTKVDHESGFNIFEVPFTDMKFNLSTDHLNYHRMLLDDFVLDGRMQSDHFVYIDSMAFNAAGGEMNLKGYFNGSNPEAIYFSPDISAKNIDLDQLLFKFENFGQDHLVSENLHGKLTGSLSGKIHMHADMIPIIDDSELHIDVNVVNGRLENYSAFEAMSDYFADKNLAQVRFDTLSNKLDFVDGTLSIPSMTINSTLGYFEVSGEQNVDLNMEYYVRIPVKVVTRAAFSKLFTKKDQDNTGQVDEIEYRDETKRTRFVNVKITGTPDNYDISLGKDK